MQKYGDHKKGTAKRRFGFVGYILLVEALMIVTFLLCNVISSFIANGNGYQHIDEKLTDTFIADLRFDDDRLLAHMRNHYLVPPSPRNQPYHLESPNKKDFSHKGLTPVIAEALSDRKNGFFIEAGAFNGETYSNSLYFEKYLNWTGLLVEADQANFERLKSKHRKAWLLKGCLHGGAYPKMMSFFGASFIGRLEADSTFISKLGTYLWITVQQSQVWCFPLEAALRAINQTKVDYTSLDVEGAEMAVLRGTPWEKFGVDLFQIEYAVMNGLWWDRDASSKRKDQIVNFMAENYSDIKFYAQVFNDIIFVRKDLTSDPVL